MDKIAKAEYRAFLGKLKDNIVLSRQKAYQAVNRHLVDLYLAIGKSIYEKVELDKWGQGTVEMLAHDLQKEFPDMRGFSKENLWRMKKIYEIYKDNQKLSTLLTELPWSHNTLILNRTKTMGEREFYLKTAIDERWSFREFERQIDSGLFERYMLSNKTAGLIPVSKDKKDIFKDEYALDFLGLKDEYSEKVFQKSILNNLKQFILELGRHFAFVGEEYKITVGGEDFKIDLLFYHRVMRCLVAVELKIGHFKPEYSGKMQFYLSALDEQEKLDGENPAVGLILCKSKNDEVVRIAISKAASPLKISTYKTGIIDTKLLKNKLHSLPMPGLRDE